MCSMAIESGLHQYMIALNQPFAAGYVILIDDSNRPFTGRYLFDELSANWADVFCVFVRKGYMFTTY
jgi:hypothetical protein